MNPDANAAPKPSLLHPEAQGPTIAVVDDDPTARHLMRFWLEGAGYQVTECDGAPAALSLGDNLPTVICVDLGLGDVAGVDVMQHLKARDADLPVIVVTAQLELETAVGAMRAGAYDYVTKPLDRDRFLIAVERAKERRELQRNVQRLESALTERDVLGSIVGKSRAMCDLAHQVSHVLDSDVAVCVFGESGTGKELVARAIHTGGKRASAPFVAVNCASIPESLQESEFFGHERGAFTGATHLRQGRFEQADGGTLLLDELGEMSLSTQASLLRTLQEQTIRRVGGSTDIPIDVRIIGATHRDLRAEVEAGRFREDLYFRLVVYPIQLPPLRARRDDIPSLIGHFFQKLSSETNCVPVRVAPDALEALSRYRWPGNVRELQNVAHRSFLACKGNEITLADLPSDVRSCVLPNLPSGEKQLQALTGSDGPEDLVVPLRELERQAIRRALKVTRGSVGQAAKLLGIGRATLYRRIASLEASPQDAA